MKSTPKTQDFEQYFSTLYDEAKGIKNPRIWTADRDKEMWAALQA